MGIEICCSQVTIVPFLSMLCVRPTCVDSTFNVHGILQKYDTNENIANANMQNLMTNYSCTMPLIIQLMISMKILKVIRFFCFTMQT